MESASVTLGKGDLTGIDRARKLARATMANIKQNLFFAFVYNSLSVSLAAGILYPFFGKWVCSLLNYTPSVVFVPPTKTFRGDGAQSTACSIKR
jgi:cation transport ATPase